MIVLELQLLLLVDEDKINNTARTFTVQSKHHKQKPGFGCNRNSLLNIKWPNWVYKLMCELQCSSARSDASDLQFFGVLAAPKVERRSQSRKSPNIAIQDNILTKTNKAITVKGIPLVLLLMLLLLVPIPQFSLDVWDDGGLEKVIQIQCYQIGGTLTQRR